jgi:1,2-diacylglycerol 3-beta-galactosyltransferase
MLKERWTLGSGQLNSALHSMIRLSHAAQVRLLERHWAAAQPDMVVSLIPHFNRALAESLHGVFPGVPFVTILTDIADCPPHFWIERQEQYFICGSARAVEQALRMGRPRSRVFRTSGMILSPRFYERRDLDRGAERARLGLDANLPTGLVLFGAEGSKMMAQIAERLIAARLQIQLILICGRNPELIGALKSLPAVMPMHVEGFTHEVPYYMQLSDFFIGKPGPGSLSEAVAMRLPIITERNFWTMPQERYNTEWVQEEGLGLVVGSFSEIAAAVKHLLDPSVYRAYKDRVAAMKNMAVFEIPDILQQVLSRAARPSGAWLASRAAFQPNSPQACVG